VSDEVPLVSVVIPTYNRADFLGETIESVLTQDYDRMQVIVLDDGSVDDTPAVLSRYRDRIIIERHPNMGENPTVNKGFGLAAGRYICVVNSDDPVLPGLIRAGVVALERNPSALAAYPNWREIGHRSEKIRDITLPNYTLSSMLTDFNVGIGPGVLFRREVLTLVGLRNPTLRYTGDLDFSFRIMLRGPMIHIPRTLATHRTHKGAASVAERDAVMAAEVVRLAEATLSDRLCPSDLVRKRRQILAHAHLDAASYCGANDRARRYHLRCHRIGLLASLLRDGEQWRKLGRKLLRRVDLRSSSRFQRWKAKLLRRVDFRSSRLWGRVCFFVIKGYFSRWTAVPHPPSSASKDPAR
jgi:glycosyltransferase involved in cell wall biosynthesis